METKQFLTKPFLTAEELAVRWSIHPHTLANWRSQGSGPKYLKLGKRVLYPFDEVEAFEKQQLKTSTVSPENKT